MIDKFSVEDVDLLKTKSRCIAAFLKGRSDVVFVAPARLLTFLKQTHKLLELFSALT